MVRRTLIAYVIAAGLSACAGTGAFGPATGTASGHVLIRACGGANRPEQTGCPSRPYAGVTLTFALSPSAGQGSEKTVRTGANGSYRIDLAPGTYTVKASGASASSTPPKPQSFADSQAAPGGFGGPHQVVVIAGKTVKADFVYTIQLL
jgi:hypothetical protein